VNVNTKASAKSGLLSVRFLRSAFGFNCRALSLKPWSFPARNNAPVVRLRWTDWDLVALAAD
jgi:hypothetical protein